MLPSQPPPPFPRYHSLTQLTALPDLRAHLASSPFSCCLLHHSPVAPLPLLPRGMALLRSQSPRFPLGRRGVPWHDPQGTTNMTPPSRRYSMVWPVRARSQMHAPAPSSSPTSPPRGSWTRRSRCFASCPWGIRGPPDSSTCSPRC
jgi:hypothetical protein